MAVPTLSPAASFEPAALHHAFTAAFADYLIGPFTLALSAWPGFLSIQGVDLAESRVALAEGEVAAFAWAAPRPELGAWRLATMGALPSARGSGAAPALLDDFLARARESGMRIAELECFAQNERALRLYRSRGFEVQAELFGYAREPGAIADAIAPAVPPVAVSNEEAFAWLAEASRSHGGLPLQVTDVSLRARRIPMSALRSGNAQVVHSVGDAALSILSLVDQDAAQRDAQWLMQALVQSHPALRFNVPQLQRLDVGGAALERLGFTRLPLHQVLMRRAL